MTPSRDQQIQALCRAVLERPPAERMSFVAELAGDDEQLRRSVELLLSQQETTDVGGGREVARIADLSIGTLLDHYRIDRVLGRGGMGVAYRATDAVVFLASDRAAYINGAKLHVDGGYAINVRN